MTIKNFLIPLLALLVYFPAKSEMSLHDMKDYIFNYDYSRFLAEADSTNPTAFWTTVQQASPEFYKAKQAAEKGKAKKAQQTIAEAVSEMYAYAATIRTFADLDPQMDSLLIDLGIQQISRSVMLKVTPELDENAYTFPGGHIYVTGGLYRRLNGDSELLLAVIAHEAAHFVLQHAFCHAYDLGRKLARAQLIGEISTAILTAAGTYADIKFASEGVGNTNIAKSGAKLGLAIGGEAITEAKRSNFIYARDQEIEADLLAYQFLRFIGHDPNAFIEALKLLDSDMEIFSATGEHPLTKDRISLLEYYASKKWENTMTERNKWDARWDENYIQKTKR